MAASSPQRKLRILRCERTQHENRCIRYRWNDAVCARLIAFAAKTTYGESCLHHYRNLTQKQWDKHVGESQEVSFKAYFYILRPALAISWIRQIPHSPPPMNLHDLIKDQNLSPDLIGHIDRLLTLKSKTKEMGHGQRIAIIDDFIHDQMAWAAVVKKNEDRLDLMAEGNNLLLYIVKENATA
ncbi:DNA polymerase beta superfamily protein [Ruegeria arenilitoris]|uniref:DNA polymerase beta superfamily protein n=1 Tax=Ruegeria arenilitoris TaxID=1173585 RepID=UPI001481C364|nr:nucleotidyltransferase domain-containing protein [Ruegeria arenilitoris]